MKSNKPASDSITTIERRLDVRRQRMARHLQELRDDLKRSRRWLPYAGAVVALGVGGFVAARARSKPAPVAEVTVRTTRRNQIAATAIALVGTAIRFAMSAHGRALWQAWRTRNVNQRRPTAIW